MKGKIFTHNFEEGGQPWDKRTWKEAHSRQSKQGEGRQGVCMLRAIVSLVRQQ